MLFSMGNWFEARHYTSIDGDPKGQQNCFQVYLFSLIKGSNLMKNKTICADDFSAKVAPLFYEAAAEAPFVTGILNVRL